jgi:AcrR family transcriptional regulator
MARTKNEDKKRAIIAEAKRLFAKSGFEGSSMIELAKGIGIPVGSLYTYFPSKDSLLETIIEEGWSEFQARLDKGFDILSRGPAASSAHPSLSKLSYMIKVALPELFKDYELIAIVMAQAGISSRLGEKLEYLASSTRTILLDYAQSCGTSLILDFKGLKSGLAVMLLGSLEAVRLGSHQALDIDTGDIVGFLTAIIEASLGCSLPDVTWVAAHKDSLL